MEKDGAHCTVFKYKFVLSFLSVIGIVIQTLAFGMYHTLQKYAKDTRQQETLASNIR